jgi:hypothetical protein
MCWPFYGPSWSLIILVFSNDLNGYQGLKARQTNSGAVLQDFLFRIPGITDVRRNWL